MMTRDECGLRYALSTVGISDPARLSLQKKQCPMYLGTDNYVLQYLGGE